MNNVNDNKLQRPLDTRVHLRPYGLSVRLGRAVKEAGPPTLVVGVKYLRRGSTRAAAHNRIGGTSHGEG